MSDELQKFIDEQFEALRKDIADAFQAARKRLLDADEAALQAAQKQDGLPPPKTRSWFFDIGYLAVTLLVFSQQDWGWRS